MNGSLIVRLGSILDPLAVEKLYPAPGQPLEVELGAGDGSFLAAYAEARPDTNFLGVERLLGRLRKIDKKGCRAGLANLRLLRLEADYLTRHLLKPGSVQAFHIYFPDPWPKRRHWKNRLVNEGFAGILARALAPGGFVHLRTDDPPYFAQMQAAFAACPAFTPVETPPELLAFQTDFERGFHARGVPTLHQSCQKRGSIDLGASDGKQD